MLAAPGRLEISGRWHGVRGRRFVRPTLTLRRASDGTEVRAFAELDHKPWAAEDDEVWVAAFATDVKPDQASVMELSVAPDITVVLAGGGDALPTTIRGAERGSTNMAPADGAGRRRRRPGAAGADQELERARARAVAAAEGLERERARRQAVEEALEAERAQGRELRVELGRLRAEVELARAARAEIAEATAERDRAGRELREARDELERLTRERDRAARSSTELKTALHERVGALESAREALAREQAEKDRLRERLTRAQGAPPPHESTSAASPPPAPPPHLPPTSRPRQLNPSLRHRTYWIGRALALLVLVAVIIAIVLVIKGTIAH